MMIAHMIGGIGNQMFIYAFAYHLSEKNNEKLKFDLSSFYNKKYNNPEGFVLDKIFHIDGGNANKRDLKEVFGFLTPFLRLKHRFNLNFLIKNFVRERHPFFFDKKLLESAPNKSYLYGFWQAHQYADLYSIDLRKKFKFKKKFLKIDKNLLNQINKTNSVSIQVRLADYRNDETVNRLHGVCDDEYFQKCINHFKSKINNPTFFVFSDEPEFVKEKKIFGKCRIVNLGKNIGSWNDMFYMSKCDHNIISNSTFGWWSAWLNENPKKIVIAPKKWLGSNKYKITDLIPKKWLKL